MNIVLTGFMATGKSEISRAISRLSDYEYIDTDKMIVEAAGKSIQSIFDEDGEAEFRRIEKEVIRRASELDRYVIATGGGVVLDPDNIDMLRKNGIIVNLISRWHNNSKLPILFIYVSLISHICKKGILIIYII